MPNKKKKKSLNWNIPFVTCVGVFILGIIIFAALCFNKTFFQNTYVGVNGQEFFIPKYCYFKSECCMTSATFISFRSKYDLDHEIDEYINEFEYFENEQTYGYQLGDLFIQSYTVVDHFFYREVIIVY